MIPSHLTEADLHAIGERLDAIGARERASLGQADRAYILRLIRAQKLLAIGGRLGIFASLAWLPAALGSWPMFWVVLCLGVGALAPQVFLGLKALQIKHQTDHHRHHQQRQQAQQPERGAAHSAHPSAGWALQQVEIEWRVVGVGIHRRWVRGWH